MFINVYKCLYCLFNSNFNLNDAPGVIGLNSNFNNVYFCIFFAVFTLKFAVIYFGVGSGYTDVDIMDI